MKPNYYVSEGMLEQTMALLRPDLYGEGEGCHSAAETLEGLKNIVEKYDDVHISSTGGLWFSYDEVDPDFSDILVPLQDVHAFMIREGLL